MQKQSLPPVVAVARFTDDMVETLQDCFEKYQDGGIVSVEINHKGLWLINPNDNSRQFLGKATFETETCESSYYCRTGHVVVQ